MRKKAPESPNEIHVETYEEYIKRTRRQAISFEAVLIPCFALVLLLLALLGFMGGGGREAALPLESPAPTESPLAAPSPSPSPAAAAPAALPAAEAEEAEPTEPPSYVPTAVYVEGELQGVLASEQAALELFAEIRRHYGALVAQEAEVPESQVSVSIQSQVSCSPAAGEEAAVITMDALFTRLTGEDTELEVLCQVERLETELLPYQVEEDSDRYLVRGTRIIEALGRDGEQTTQITDSYINGEKQRRSESQVLRLVEPVTERIRVGSQKQTSTTKADRDEGREGPDTELRFISPIKGSVTANYGQIGGVLHLGLDYAPEGDREPVVAACAGRVVCAMARGGYGLMVEIDHGDGFVSRYACLSSLAVSLGDEVAAGQTIGILEQGEEEEAFLHFELRVNGEAYNPRYYLD